jgi:hypothetical protein
MARLFSCRLLYLLASSLDGRRDVQQVAALLSVEFGRVVSARQVSYLIEHRLQPTGITAADPGAVAAGGTASMKMTSDPLLALKFRGGWCLSVRCGTSQGSSDRGSGHRGRWNRARVPRSPSGSSR